MTSTMASAYRTSPIRPLDERRRWTERELEVLRGSIHATTEAAAPATVRQVFYLLEARGEVLKTGPGYDRVARLVLQMRREGRLPFEWIVDSTRWMRKPRTYSSLEQMLRSVSSAYRRSVWDDQDVYVEVWCEKDALAGVLYEITEQWDVPLMVARGFSSETYLYEAAQAFERHAKPAFVYYVGDHDDSGVLAQAAVERALVKYAPNIDFHFERIAVTPEQIDELALPTRPPKASNHDAGLRGGHVEVDALPPAYLRELVRDRIERHVDKSKLSALLVAEASERDVLMRMVGEAG